VVAVVGQAVPDIAPVAENKGVTLDIGVQMGSVGVVLVAVHKDYAVHKVILQKVQVHHTPQNHTLHWQERGEKMAAD